MRIGSTADWHIGDGMDADIEASVLQIVKIFREQKVDYIALPGDFFDHKSAADGRNLLRMLIQEMCTVAPVVACTGNHDQPGDLNIFGHLDLKNGIILVDKPYIHWPPQDPQFEQITFHLLPWFTKATWQSHHIGASKEEGDKTVSQMALQYVKNNVILEKAKNPNVKNILISHLLVEGALAQNHQPLIGEGISFGQYDLTESGLYAGIFGHIHLGQNLDATNRFFYPGSPAAMDYGENPDKFCAILDTMTGCTEWYKLQTVDRFSIECIWPLQLSMTPEQYGEMKTRAKGARVRALLQIEEGANLAHAKEELEKILLEAGALEVKIDPQVRPKELVRSVEISKAESLEEKLDVFWKATNKLPDEATVIRMKNKLSIIEQRCR
jgi:DNA repair exonuclease SbcCD nuclease subunit